MSILIPLPANRRGCSRTGIRIDSRNSLCYVVFVMTTITIRIEEQVLKRLKDIGKKQERPVASIIRLAVNAFLLKKKGLEL